MGKDFYVTILLVLSILMILTLFLCIILMKNKRQIHYVFLGLLASLLIWSVSGLVEMYMISVNNYSTMLIVNVSYIGVCLVPVFLFYIGILFANTKIKISLKHFAPLVVPIISLLIIWTNRYHHWFYIKYAPATDDIIYGTYAYVHLVYSYVCILIGLYYLMYFSIKNSGFFSKQSVLISVGTIISLSVNILSSFNIVKLPKHITPISFAVAMIFFALAIFKFKFLNIVPIALQKVVDNISDSFVVINDTYNIVDYNKTFMDSFKDYLDIVRNNDFLETINSSQQFKEYASEFSKYIECARKQRMNFSTEIHLKSDSFGNYYTVDFSPIFTGQTFIGTIILFKDITQNKKDLETIKRNHAILMEQERLASLGQLIGGIAHNLRTPIMSIAGGIEGIRDLVAEYRESIGDPEVTAEDHREIARDIESWLDRMKPHCTYMSDVISAVKGQAIQYDSSEFLSFTIDELCKRIDILMNHELKKYHCNLILDLQVDKYMELKGELNMLIQVFDNIIMNAIQAYDGRRGDIRLTIKKQIEQLIFSFEDKAGGIRPDIQNKLFKEMTTTKGKNGTGLGLFMSYSTIKGKFGGDIWFETEYGKGTTFFVSIPAVYSRNTQEVS